MSSAILYLAIIAIWAGFLVPAWLRRPHANSDSVADAEAPSASETETYEAEVDSHAERKMQVQFVDELAHTESGVEVHVEADVHVEVSEHVYVDESVYPEVSGYTEDYGPEYPEYVDREGSDEAWAGSGPPAPRPSQSRDQMLRARRRMLTILVGMTAVTGLFTFVGVVAWWIMAPPALLLALYVLLLREIAMADGELARKQAAWEAAEARAYERHLCAEAEAERRAAEAAAADSGAQIIDISGRVRDELYDQYADAAVRAVGD